MHPMKGEGHLQQRLLPVACITDCPTITGPHAGNMLQITNRFRSCNIFAQVFNLQKIEDCCKTPIQPTTAKLNTADGMTALHLRIAKFKFTHNFIICDQLAETELIFGIDIKRKFSISYALDKDKNVSSKKKENF